MAAFKEFKRKDGTVGRIRVEHDGKRNPKAVPPRAPDDASSSAAGDQRQAASPLEERREPAAPSKQPRQRAQKAAGSEDGGGWVLVVGLGVLALAGAGVAWWLTRD